MSAPRAPGGAPTISTPYQGWPYDVAVPPETPYAVVKITPPQPGSGGGPVAQACSQAICPGGSANAFKTRPAALQTVRVSGTVNKATQQVVDAGGNVTAWILDPESTGSVTAQLARRVAPTRTVEMWWVENLDQYPNTETLVAIKVA
jgi:hypothetical protein